MGVLFYAIGFAALVVATAWYWATRRWIAIFDPAARSRKVEWLLAVVVPLVGAATFWPFFHDGIVGAGDSYHYSLQVADAITQGREGHWPLLVGQSVYAFNGNIHTIRTAPLFTHLAVIFDFLSWHRLQPWELTNFMIVLFGALSAWIAYLCARWIAPQWRVSSALLAVLYVTAPAIATTVLSSDMVATFMAAPFLPLIWTSALQMFRRGSAYAWALFGGASGLAWLAHPPTAIWISLPAGLIVIFAVFKFPLRTTAVGFLAAAALSVPMVAYMFYSVYSLRNIDVPHAESGISDTILYYISEGWPQSFRLLDPSTPLGSFQLGYALWLVVAGGCVVAVARRAGALALACVSALALLCFVAPIPHLNPWLWRHVPTAISIITNDWPMQRIYPILCAGAVSIGALALAAIPSGFPLVRRSIALTLFVASLWSGGQISRLEISALHHQQSREFTALQLDPNNAVLTRSSYALFDSIPPYYTHAWTDAETESRLLDANQKVVLTDIDAALQHASPNQFFHVFPNRALDLHLQPDEDVLFTFEFAPDPGPEVTIEGTHLRRIYSLPMSGLAQSFGSGPTNSRALRLKSSDQNLSFTIHASDSTRIRGLVFHPSELPIRVTSLTPYRATVTAEKSGFLETPIVFVRGYAAQVNGHAVTPIRSMQGLLAVPVTAGVANVEVTYPGPFGLKWLGWLTTFASLAFLALLIWPRPFSE